jgi:hypothetical protein
MAKTKPIATKKSDIEATRGIARPRTSVARQTGATRS